MSSENKKGFFRGIAKEFKKVTWPTGSELVNTSLVVIVAIVLISTLTYALDSLLHFLLSFTL